jgi:hypothetical protein
MRSLESHLRVVGSNALGWYDDGEGAWRESDAAEWAHTDRDLRYGFDYLAVGGAISTALREQVERFDKLLAVDAARDEIERAHALADIYREERGEAISLVGRRVFLLLGYAPDIPL